MKSSHPYRLKTGVTIGAFVFACLLSFHAFTQSLSDTVTIKEVRVYGKKPLSESGMIITKVDTMILRSLQTLEISDLLSQHTPVYIKSYGRGSAASASFRGAAPSHTQVLWNGMALNSPMRGDVDFSLFPVYMIDDMSLLHGGSSLLAGTGALGGSILLGNKPDWGNRFNLRYVQTVESFNTFKEYLNVGGGFSSLQFKVRLFLDRSENDFPFFNYGVLPMHKDVQENASYHKCGFLQETYYKKEKHVFSLKTWAYKSHRDLPQLMSFEGGNRVEYQNDENLRIAGDWRFYSGNSKVDVMLGLNLNELDYFRSSTEASFVNFNSKSREKSLMNKIDYEWGFSDRIKFHWSLSSQYSRVNIFDDAQQTGYDEDRVECSLLNAIHVQLSERLTSSFLLRSEIYSDQIIGFIPALGTELSLNEERSSSLVLNLSRNYHKPNLNDLYWLPGGNPDLKPEDSYTGEMEWSIAKKNESVSFQGDVTGFISSIDNWIVWRPAANGAFYWEADNYKKVFSRGFELKANFKWEMHPDLLLVFNGYYSYTKTTNQNAVNSVDQSRGKQLIYIPKHKANLFGEINYKSWYLKTNVPFTGKRYTNSSNAESIYEKVLNPYWLVHTTIGCRKKLKSFGLDASFHIENLLNEEYMAILWRPMPGRYYSVTLQIIYHK